MKKINKVIIPVAGLGTRMLPATKAIPKEMLPVLNKPIIQYIVEEAIYAGFKEIILVTHSSKSSIEDHFDKSFELEAALLLPILGKVLLLKQLKKLSFVITVELIVVSEIDCESTNVKSNSEERMSE